MHPKYPTLEAFVASRTPGTCECYGEDGDIVLRSVLNYGEDMCCIQILEDGSYYLHLERDEHTGSLETLEPILYAWFLSEF